MFVLEVQRVTEKACFVSLPPQIVDDLISNNPASLGGTLELQWRATGRTEGVAAGRGTQAVPEGQYSRTVLVSWSGGSSMAHDRIEVPAALAECLGLSDGLRVEVRVRTDLAIASRIDVEPVATDDWEIIELHAEHLEEQLLNQVEPAATGHTCCKLKIVSFCLLTAPLPPVAGESCVCRADPPALDTHDDSGPAGRFCSLDERASCECGFVGAGSNITVVATAVHTRRLLRWQASWLASPLASCLDK